MTMSTVTQLKTRVERWAEKINAAHGESVQAIIEVGRQLQQAKAECSHGEWGELTGRTTGKPLLPFSHRTARMFKAIADNAVLSNGHHGTHLPASWRTLAVLASLDPDDVPLSKGGTNDFSNLRLMHAFCNREKSNALS